MRHTALWYLIGMITTQIDSVRFHNTVFVIGCLAVCMMLSACTATQVGDEKRIDMIVFASCAKPNQPETIWQSIIATDPDVFVFIGDNVYVDVPRKPKGVEDFERTYAQLASEPGWQKLRAKVPVIATWDDHDYGLNDSGKEFPLKEIAQKQFIDFFDLPEDSPVRQREGIYDAHTFGPEGQRVQVILLDTRYFRDKLARNPKGRIRGLGPFIPHKDKGPTLLGEAQWVWLEAQLKQPADVRIIASSIQVIAEEHGWETWGNFPHERDRLYQLIGDTKASGVVFISGDRHLTECSRDLGPDTPYAMFDLTSSGMNDGTNPNSVSEPNRHRMKADEVYRRSNFGVIRLDWDNVEGPTVWLESRSEQGELLIGYPVTLKSLQVDSQ